MKLLRERHHKREDATTDREQRLYWLQEMEQMRAMKSFKSFRLDTANHFLWRDGDRVSLTPKRL